MIFMNIMKSMDIMNVMICMHIDELRRLLEEAV